MDAIIDDVIFRTAWNSLLDMSLLHHTADRRHQGLAEEKLDITTDQRNVNNKDYYDGEISSSISWRDNVHVEIDYSEDTRSVEKRPKKDTKISNSDQVEKVKTMLGFCFSPILLTGRRREMGHIHPKNSSRED